MQKYRNRKQITQHPIHNAYTNEIFGARSSLTCISALRTNFLLKTAIVFKSVTSYVIISVQNLQYQLMHSVHSTSRPRTLVARLRGDKI